MQATEKIWMNGELVDWDDAKIHVGTHGLHYGSGVFEGIRCYETADGPAVFRLTDHLRRLHNSARLINMEIPFTVDDLRTATHDVVSACAIRECYIRPIAFYGYGQLGVAARVAPQCPIGRQEWSVDATASAVLGVAVRCLATAPVRRPR